MAKNKKVNSKVISQQKHRHRQWVTFLRMCRYGVNNFSRNAWLTIAATAIMTITLLVIFVSLASQNVLQHTLNDVRDRITVSIFLKTDTTQDQVNQVVSEVKKLSSVKSVSTESPQQAREIYVNDNKSDNDTLDAVKEATNKFPWAVKVKVADINDFSQLRDLLANNQVVKPYLDPNNSQNFDDDKQATAQTIGRTASFIQQVSIVLSIVFASISMLIIFNTIRMAIFNRREEIQMMKLIGAERSFIRGPFIVEAAVYGFFAAILATALGMTLILLIEPALTGFGVSAGPTVELLKMYLGFVIVAMIAAGALIGIISSLLATQRYLKL